jgi:hypothetical protein
LRQIVSQAVVYERTRLVVFQALIAAKVGEVSFS